MKKNKMDFDLENREWKAFKIGDIFIVSTGANIPKNFLQKGSIPRITATDNNNGIFDFYKKTIHKNSRVETNFISISFLGSVFYHPYLASLDMKIHSVKIPNIKLNKFLAEFIVLCFKKTSAKFSYGNQLSSKDLPKNKILFPINSKGEPDYEFMEQFIRHKEQKIQKEYQEYIQERINQLKNTPKTVSLSEKEWKEFFLSEIFTEIQRGKRLKKADHIEGSKPYISSTGSNNGLDGFIGNTNNVRIFKNCLTIANSGSVGSCFYQPYSFVASDHVTKLKNSDFNRSVYLFIASIVSRLGVKYSFNREMNDTRIKREKIMLPINEKHEPDYTFMENYMKNLEYKKLIEYIKFKNQTA